jgi:hypothetical protein
MERELWDDAGAKFSARSYVHVELYGRVGGLLQFLREGYRQTDPRGFRGRARRECSSPGGEGEDEWFAAQQHDLPTPDLGHKCNVLAVRKPNRSRTETKFEVFLRSFRAHGLGRQRSAVLLHAR